MTRHLIVLTILLILVAVTGSLVWSVMLHENHDFVVSVTAFSVGVITFFGVIALNRGTRGQQILKAENLRTAIACSLVISYLFIVCFTTFVRTADTTGEVSQEFVKSFSNVIGITIAFYFGASAATQIFDRNRQAGVESVTKNEKEE